MRPRRRDSRDDARCAGAPPWLVGWMRAPLWFAPPFSLGRWVWLAVDTAAGNRMIVTTTANQDVPYAAKAGVVPILGLDVWEHAYYVQYQNRRPDYVEVR